MKKMKRIISSILLIATIISVIPSSLVYASSANFMAGQMMSFFQGAAIEDISTITVSEAHVYSVFVSNFYKPGVTKLKDLATPDSELSKKILETFFGSSAGENNKTQVDKLHKIIYDSIINGLKEDVSSENSFVLYEGPASTDARLTGLGLLKKMAGSGSSKIYFGGGRKETLDLSSPAVGAAFQLLNAYSVDFMLSSKGISSYKWLYLDGYGNIWGSATEQEAVYDDLVLILPACLNPTAFAPGATPSNIPNLKVPLTNSFAMGAFIDINNLSSTFTSENVPYYNIPYYFRSGSKEQSNILNIMGISSPLPYVLDSTSTIKDTSSINKGLAEFFSKGYTEISKEENHTVIVFSINTETVHNKLSDFVPDLDMENIEKSKLIDYLLKTTRYDIDNLNQTMYYIADLTSNSIGEWEDTFDQINMYGAHMFLDGESTIYSNAIRNKNTDKLGNFFNSIDGEIDIFNSNEITEDNIKKHLIMAEKIKDIYSVAYEGSAKKEVTVTIGEDKGGNSKENYTFAYVISRYKEGDKIADLVIESEKMTDKTEVKDVPIDISALLYLKGVTNGEKDETDYYYYPGSTGYLTIKSLPTLLAVENGTAWALTPAKIKTKVTTANGWLFGWPQKKEYLIPNITAEDDKVLSSLVVNLTSLDSISGNSNNRIYHLFHTYTLFSSHGLNIGSSEGSGSVAGVEFTSNGDTMKTSNFIADKTNYWPGIFFGYMVEILSMKQKTDITVEEIDGETSVKKHYDTEAFTSKLLPYMSIPVTGTTIDFGNIDGTSGVSNSEELTMEEMQKDLLKKIYGIVSDGPNAYRDRWIKNTVDGFLLSIHRAITGSWLADMATVSAGSGSTYQGVVGYIYTPTLEDLPFTSWIMGNYMQIYVFALVLVAFLLVLMVLTRLRTWQQGSAIFILMCVALLFPNILISNTVNISNKAADMIYSDRFDFWAMTQHQQASRSLTNSGGQDSKANIIISSMQKAESTYSGDAGVRVKWMSPKKTDVFNSLYTNAGMSESFAVNLQIFKWLFNSFIYDSEFIGDDPLATYLYRPYNSLAREASEYFSYGEKYLLNSVESKDITTVSAEKAGSRDRDIVSTDVETYKIWKDILERSKDSGREEIEKDFYAGLLDSEFYKKDNFANIFYDDAKLSDLKKVGTYRTLDSTVESIALWGVGNTDITDVIFSEVEEVVFSPKGGISSRTVDNMSIDSLNEEEAHLAAFLKNTESPYYYFYNTLKHRYGSGKGFKQALLNRDIYKVYDVELDSTSVSANGAVRDFLDLEGLFTYMIPYLSASNDYVYRWTSINGTKISDFDFEADTQGGNDDYIKQKALKESMGRVWNMYAPWVDQLNSLDTRNQKVRIANKNVIVEDTLNPSYYLLAGRPMIFSEADMIAKGYTVRELSDVERRIQEVLETTYIDLMYLVNYYDLDDDVLVSAAAMYATFNFNREFSQSRFLGESTMIYPQSFELKNFNYDAFMRLTLLNSTGETIFAKDDLYVRVLQKTSIFTGILLLIADLIACIVIPTAKFIILLGLLFLGLLICITCVVSPPEKIFEAVNKSLLVPAVLFMVSNIVFSAVVSVFVGEGLTSYVGSKGISIATNDPTITILLLIVVGVIYVICLWHIMKMLIKAYKSFGMATFTASVGVLGGAMMGAVNRISQSSKGVVSSRISKESSGYSRGNAVEGMLSRKSKQMLHRQEEDNHVDGKGISKSIDDKASKPNIKGLSQENYTAGGTILGNKLEDITYKKHKVLDNFNEKKHKVNEKIVGAKKTIEKGSNTAKDIVTGKYLGQSLAQMKEKDNNYKSKRKELDRERLHSYSSNPEKGVNNSKSKKIDIIDTVIDSAKEKGGNGNA